MIFYQENAIEDVICKMVDIVWRPQYVNTLRPGQNGRHVTDDSFKCIFLNDNWFNLIKSSLKFVPKGPINN